jgi:hypothetical protein
MHVNISTIMLLTSSTQWRRPNCFGGSFPPSKFTSALTFWNINITTYKQQCPCNFAIYIYIYHIVRTLAGNYQRWVVRGETLTPSTWFTIYHRTWHTAGTISERRVCMLDLDHLLVAGDQTPHGHFFFIKREKKRLCQILTHGVPARVWLVELHVIVILPTTTGQRIATKRQFLAMVMHYK